MSRERGSDSGSFLFPGPLLDLSRKIEGDSVRRVLHKEPIDKIKKKAIICHYYSHWINDWKFTKVTKVNRQLIRPSSISFVLWTSLPNLTVVLLSCSGLFFTKILAFHSLLCLIDHHKKSISLVRKPDSFLRTWFSRSCAYDDWQRLKFQNTTEHWKVFISSPKAQVTTFNFWGPKVFSHQALLH